MSIDTSLIQGILFDVDGTLSDTDDIFQEKLYRILKTFRDFLPGRDLSKLARRIIMSLEAPGNFLIGLPDLVGFDDEIYAIMDYLARKSHPRFKEHRVISGVPEMLSELSLSFPLGVVSARDERTTRLFLDNSGLSSYFQCIATAQTCKHTKPFPDPLLWAAQEMKVPPENCLMVGDTTVDIRAGKAAGTQTLGVLCGFGEKMELEKIGADMILGSTSDLMNIFKPGG